MQLVVGTTLCVLVRGDITLQHVDAIVNAANSGLLGGGGVDGAIHRAGGPAILAACREIREQRGPLPPGEAVVTTAGRLPSRMVVHTVGPVWRGGTGNEDEILRSAYRNSLRVALERGAATIAFPSISTGAYGFPPERASRIAFDAVRTFVREHPQMREVRFVTFTSQDHQVYAPLFAASTPDGGTA